MTKPEVTKSPRTSIERRKSLLGVLLLLGVVVAIVGESISAAGAPEIGVVDTWGRIDEAVSQIASWQYLLVVLAALLLLGGFRAERVDLAGSRSRRLAWFGVVAELTALAVGAAVGIVALFERTADADVLGGVGVSDYYSSTERIGETVAYVAIMIVAIGLAAFVRNQTRTKDPTPDS